MRFSGGIMKHSHDHIGLLLKTGMIFAKRGRPPVRRVRIHGGDWEKAQTVRGVELDVYAQEEVKQRKYQLSVSANTGKLAYHRMWCMVLEQLSPILELMWYIVSLAGFQEGAYKAAGLTNTELVTWQELQDKFELSWYENFFFLKCIRTAWSFNDLLQSHFYRNGLETLDGLSSRST